MKKRKFELDKELVTMGANDDPTAKDIDGGAPTFSCQCTWEFCTMIGCSSWCTITWGEECGVTILPE